MHKSDWPKVNFERKARNGVRDMSAVRKGQLGHEVPEDSVVGSRLKSVRVVGRFGEFSRISDVGSNLTLYVIYKEQSFTFNIYIS